MRWPFDSRYGPWAIVTGASSGIGEAFAHALAVRGVASVLVARRKTELARVARDVEKAYNVQCACLALDLASAAFIDTLLECCSDKDVGLVVGNAAFNPAGAFNSMSRDELMRMLDVNARANLLLAHGFMPKLKARGRGGFLMVGSVEGFSGVPYSACYSSSKALVLSLGEALWGENLETGVDVLVLAPGATDTPLLRSRNLSGMNIKAMSAREVAEFGLDRLNRGPSAIPGFGNRWRRRIMGLSPRAEQVKGRISRMGKIAEQSRKDAVTE